MSTFHEAAPPRAHGVTVQQLAEAKKLPVSFLRQLFLVDLDNNAGVGIPYFDLAGDKIALKKRTSLIAKEGSYWPAKTPLAAYGQWRFHEASKMGWLILVEGESDCWTLWHHGYPALGIPGAGAAKTLTRDLLVGINKLYIHVEDDQGGSMFQDGILRRLAELDYKERTFTFHLAQGIKDPSALHIADEPNFHGRLLRGLHSAEPHTPTHLHVRIHRGDTPTTEAKSVSPSPGPARQSSQPKADIVRTPKTTRISDVAEDKVSWLWPGRIPLGKLTVLDGDPGLGKSTVTLDIAARVTRGLPMPALTKTTLPASAVVLLTAEDGLGDTIRPRLAAAGADLAKVVAFEGIATEEDQLLPVWMPQHIQHLKEIVVAHQARLVLIDPLMAYLPESVNSNNDQSVRQALLPLGEMAQELNVAVIVVRHLNKQPGRNALYRGGGSIGIVGAARSALLVVKDQDVPTRRFLGVTKSNLCKQPRTLSFELISGSGSPTVLWHEETDVEIERLLAPAQEEPESPAEKEAVTFLRDRLANGPVSSTVMLAEAKDLGISEKTLRRAKDRVGVDSERIDDPDETTHYWAWQIREDR